MRNLKTLLFFIALIMGNTFLFGQTTEPTFFIVETMKATPDKGADYVKAEQEVWKKIHQERIKQGLISSWSLYAVLSPSGTNAPYDFVTVTGIVGWNKLENPWGTIWDGGMEKMLTKEQLAIANGTIKLRNLTSSITMYMVDFVSADSASTTPPKYQVINYMKVKEAMTAEYLSMETELVKPMHVEMMKSGGRSAWGLYGRVFGGSSQPFDFVTSDFYNTWSDMNEGESYSKTLEKVHPKMSMTTLEKRITSSRDMVNQELWQLIDHIR
jgi:L-rhamnose mutarotase